MAYAGISDLFGRYKPLRTMVGVGSFAVSSVDVSSMFIADAESFADAYLGIRYDIPISPVPSLVTQITADLAIFNMLAEKHPTVPDHMQARYDRTIKLLEMLRDGEMTLPSSVSVKDAGDQEVWSSNQDFHAIFHPALSELDQAADQDWVEEARDDRVGDIGVERCER